MIDPQTKAGLEERIESNSLATVLEDIAAICFEQAEYLRDWQSNVEAKEWKKYGKMIRNLAAKIKL